MNRPRHPHLAAILLMLKASFAFSIMAFCVKLASRSLPSLEIVFLRSLIGSCLIFGLILKKRISVFGRERPMMALRGLSGFVALSLHFYTISRLPLGTAVILNYTAPIFSAILAITFLSERPRLLVLLSMLMSFVGVYFLIGGQFQTWNMNVSLGLLSAVFAAIAYVSIRAIKQKESPLTIIFYFTGISTVGSAFFLLLGFQWPTFVEWLEIAGVGIGSFYGQLWMTMSLREAPTSLVAPFSYFTPLLTFFYGLVFFHERLLPVSLLGAFLIMLGGSLISYFETRTKPRAIPR